MGKRSDEDYTSVEEVEEALQKLSNVDLIGLDEISRDFIAENSIISPEKLLEETLNNILEGRRRWPSDVDIMTFLRNALRSQASGYWPKQDKMFNEIRAGSNEEKINNPEEELISSEHEDLVQKRYNEIENLFKGYDVIEAILIGREEGWPPLEIQQQFSISKTDYASALRQMRRKLSKTYPEGWQTW